MAKGNAVLKIAGILLALFGILNILWSMLYGFLGAKEFSESGQEVLTGLLMFYGMFGIVTGLFQIGVSSVCIRHANFPKHWLRCVVYGVITFVLGLVNTLTLLETSSLIGRGHLFYPQWFGFAIVILGGILLPLLVVLGGFLNKATYRQSKGNGSASENNGAAAA